MNNYHVIMRWKLQIQTVILSYGKVSFLMLFQGSYRCLEWSAPSLYIPCAQHGAVNCSQTHPEMLGLFPSCAAPAASFSKICCIKSNLLGYCFQFILLTIKSKVNVEVITCWLRRLTFFTSLFFTHSINRSSRYDTEQNLSDKSIRWFRRSYSKRICCMCTWAALMLGSWGNQGKCWWFCHPEDQRGWDWMFKINNNNNNSEYKRMFTLMTTKVGA